MKSSRLKSLKDYIDSLQGKGRYVFLRDQAIKDLGFSENAFRIASGRLKAKSRIAKLRNGIYVIVPIEYKSAGAPPPSWYIEDLMKFHGQDYYVGLLSAAALHGAAHYQPQEFQVMTTVPLRSVKVGRARINFFTKRHFSETPTQKIKTPTGFIPVSTPEATALDLLRYVSAVGFLHNVLSVLEDLMEKLDSKRLLEAAKLRVELTYAQRLGFLLDYLGGKNLTSPLHKWILKQNPHLVLLRSDLPFKKATKNNRWNVLVNEILEPNP